MNCCWCGANPDGTDSHGICPECAESILLQSLQRQFDRIPSYVERFKHASAEIEEQEKLVA